VRIGQRHTDRRGIEALLKKRGRSAVPLSLAQGSDVDDRSAHMPSAGAVGRVGVSRNRTTRRVPSARARRCSLVPLPFCRHASSADWNEGRSSGTMRSCQFAKVNA